MYSCRKAKNTMNNINCVLLILTLFQCYTANEIGCLNNLKISELLLLQHSVHLLSCENRLQSVLQPEAISTISLTNTSVGIDSPSALALTNARSYPEPWKEKPTKLQTLFQVSITALAFLSFGGYLLCLIVQAIKSKGTTYFHPVATATTTTNGQLKKIKIFRRSRRMVNTTREVHYYANDYSLASPDPVELYKTMLYFAEGYAMSAESFL